MEPLNLILVGCGMMGKRHLRGYAELERVRGGLGALALGLGLPRERERERTRSNNQYASMSTPSLEI